LADSRPQGRNSWTFFLFLLGFAYLGFSGCTGSENPLFQRPAGQLEGKIVNPQSQPVSQVAVRLENTLQSSGSSLTDAGGTYSIASADPGTYDLIAEKKIGAISFRARRRFLKVSGAAIKLDDIQIRPAGTIRGTVELEGQASSDGVEAALIGTGRSVTTAADGTFEFTDIAYTYREDSTNRLLLYDITLKKTGFSIRTIENVSLEAGGLTVLDTVLLDNLDPATVADVTGEIILEARSGAFETKLKILGTAFLPIMINSDDPGQRGFRFKSLPPGTFVLKASHPDYYPQEVGFRIDAGQTVIDLGTLTLTNVRHYDEDRKALDLTLSPGGHQIAYARWEPDNTFTHREIFIMDIEGLAYNTRISDRARVSEDRGMSWSADGKHLIFVEKNDTAVSRLYRLDHISSSGGLITALTSYSLDVSQPGFAPDDTRIVYHRFEESGDILGGTLVKKPSGFKIENEFLIIPERNDQISQNQISSIELGISDRVLYSKDSTGAFTVPLSANGDLNLRFPILNFGPDAHSVTYSTDNSRIAYAISSGSGAGLYISGVDGSSPERIAIAYGRALEFTTNGKDIVFIDQRSSWSRRIATAIVPRHLR
jgi:hypothetical protein